MAKELEKEVRRWLPYRLHEFRHKGGFKKEFSLKEIVEAFNKESSAYSILKMLEKEGVGNPEQLKKFKERYKYEKLTLKHKKLIKEVLNKNELYFADYKFYDDVFKRVEYKPLEVVFNTSGKIIVENDLRQFFEEGEDFDINSTKGIIQTMEHYAKQGMLHGFVGNSCPGVYLSLKHGTIHIGANYDEETDEEVLPDDSYERITSVCTDLWWYSIMDLELFKKMHPDYDTSNFTIVDIPKGKWILKHKYGISENGYHENLPYATLELQGRKKIIEKK